MKLAAPQITPGLTRAVSTRLVDRQIEHIQSVLDSCGWRIRGESGAARRLGVKPTTLESLMARLGIARKRDSGEPFAVATA